MYHWNFDKDMRQKMQEETTVLRAFVLGESRATWLLTLEKIHIIIGNIVCILFVS